MLVNIPPALILPDIFAVPPTVKIFPTVVKVSWVLAPASPVLLNWIWPSVPATAPAENGFVKVNGVVPTMIGSEVASLNVEYALTTPSATIVVNPAVTFSLALASNALTHVPLVPVPTVTTV